VPSKKSQPELLEALLKGDRRALARAITLIESHAHHDQGPARDLLRAAMPHSGNSLRIGISGPPGVGKSTFIEALGQKILAEGSHKLAVLTIDPTSRISGGSILGDKTRMEELSRHEGAFIRPSPGGDALGGVARQTRESIFLVEAAGHDVVIIETIGVGQSEATVASMVDLFLLLHQPNSGDDLQGIKRGNLELADFVIVTKADGELHASARKAQVELMHALSYFATSGHPAPPVMACSSVTGEGIPEILKKIHELAAERGSDGRQAQRRKDQMRQWFHQEIQDQLLAAVEARPDLAAIIAESEAAIDQGKLAASAAAELVVKKILGKT
jgi:LAO/AO transport system kinase